MAGVLVREHRSEGSSFRLIAPTGPGCVGDDEVRDSGGGGGRTHGRLQRPSFPADSGSSLSTLAAESQAGNEGACREWGYVPVRGMRHPHRSPWPDAGLANGRQA